MSSPMLIPPRPLRQFEPSLEPAGPCVQRKATIRLLFLTIFVLGLTVATRPPPQAAEIDSSSEPARSPTLQPGALHALPVSALEPGDQGFAQAQPAVEDCLQGWWMRDPALEAVVLEVQLDEAGLAGAAVLDHTGLPPQVETCLGEALSVQWPAGDGALRRGVRVF